MKSADVMLHECSKLFKSISYQYTGVINKQCTYVPELNMATFIKITNNTGSNKKLWGTFTKSDFL